MADLILYSYFRSSASHRVRIALNLKGLPYEYKAVHLLNNGGEQNRDDYTQLNPLRQVPTLIHKGRAIGQSMAILDYLEWLEPAPALFPKEPYARALVLQACEIINSGIQPLGNLSVVNELEKRAGFDQAKKNEWIQHWIHKGLTAFESMIRPHAGRFCFGDGPTAADCFLVPQVFGAIRFGADLGRVPLLAEIHETCMGLKAFANAAPGAQPDAPQSA